ncbi:neural/ectodermal development factor IMP-L2-like [Pieris brassicae]|uniref:Hemolin n=1 Tax=Pieris brassicae TaxID=7116 RepID=A0A9P0TKW8_PIEBR|nr:neural/ectodermal development factor IMP-L2-like [Pieris brassicae]CAH4029205.1 unnamed protein product [Pieris brassicae]
MYAVLLFAAAALLSNSRAANVNRHMKLLDINNDIETNTRPSAHQTKRFITITKRPASRSAHVAGATLELTCEAIAAPAPSVHWFKNDAPVYEYDKESNEMIDTNPSSLGRVRSTLLVTRNDAPSEYSCLILSGSKTARASTVVYSSEINTDLTERSKLVPLSPKILVSYKMFVDIIGSNIVLPCRVKGHPRPIVTWTDNNGESVKKNPGMKVLRSGELVISQLRWKDMGEFTCRAKNLFGSAEAKTFVYPARPNDTDG